MVIQHLKQTGSWKTGCSIGRPKIKKIIILKCLLLLYTTKNHFSIRLWCTTISDNQLSGWTEKKLQSTFPSQTCTKKRSWSLFDGLLPVWSTTAFWISAKPLYLRSKLSKSMRCTEKCTTSSWHWLTARARFFSTTTPNSTLHNQCFKSWTNWAMKFCLICHIHLTSCQPATTLQASAQLFAGKTLSQPAGGRKCFPRIHQILKHRFSNKPISCWQKCVVCNGYYFD